MDDERVVSERIGKVLDGHTGIEVIDAGDGTVYLDVDGKRWLIRFEELDYPPDNRQ